MEFEAQEGLKSQENETRKNSFLLSKNVTLILLSLLLLLIITITVTFLGTSKNKVPENLVPIVTPPIVIITATPRPVPPDWASSSAILKIDNDNRNVKSEIDNTDFSEPALNLPAIDTKVDFNK